MAVAVLGLLQACSAVKLAYNNAPEFAYWWIDGYADLDEAQALKVRAELARLQQWHRASELPRIAELLARLRQIAPADTSAEQACSVLDEARRRVDAVIAFAEPTTVEVAMGLSAAQLAHIEGKLAKANTEWREAWMDGTPAERQARRIKAAVERSEQFYGTLEERQLAVLRGAIQQSEFDPQLAYAERLRRQRDMLQTLRQVSPPAGAPRPTAAQAGTLLRAMTERSFASPDPALRAYGERVIQAACRTVALVHNSTTPEQRERAARRLGAYERDARELAQKR